MPSPAKLLASASGVTPDPYFRNVTLLLHGDGSNGAQNNTFLDSSSNNFTVTRNGNTTQGSFSPYGTRWSNYFDGSGDYLTAPDNAPLQLGSSDFTIEFWVNFSSVPGASQGATLVSKFDTSNTGYEVILFNNTLYFQAQSADIGLTYAWTPTAGRWYHIAWSRSGANSYGFIDGVLVASTSAASGAISNLNQALQLGRRGDNTFYLNGYLSDVRVVKGTAVYTAAFTPPTAPLTAITNTSLLTCQSNRFRDASTNNFAITRNGDVRVTPFSPTVEYSPATNLGSGYFDGTGDKLALPNDAAFQYGTGDFTVEAWIYMTSITPSSSPVMATSGNTGGSGGTYTGVMSNGNIEFFDYVANTRVANGGTITPYQWQHIAVTRSGTTLRIFQNGTQVASGTCSSNFTGSASGGGVGSWVTNDTGLFFNGYISNLRAVKGTAVYTSSFTPPSSPLTSISGTSLLLNFTNAAIFDASAKNDLETVGNAQINTSVKKFGTGSMYFDGSGDYLRTVTKPEFGLGTGDFTIEYWVYPALTGDSNQIVIDARPSDAATPWLIGHTTGGAVRYYDGSTVRTGGTMSANTWNHVAWSRQSGVNRVFLNGSQVSTYTATQDFGSTRGLTIGGNVLEPYERLTGYIDDLRITKGVARYTANFTPPAAPFPDQ